MIVVATLSFDRADSTDKAHLNVDEVEPDL